LPAIGARARLPAADVALAYLQSNAAALGLTASDVSDVAVGDSVLSAHAGVTHVYLRQRAGGVPVAGGIVNVNVAPDGRVLSPATASSSTWPVRSEVRRRPL
jgi:extracellular elastinolytic metalloproteinase